MIVGTAGHIDHGKTALVRALTGVDTDRLPEERRRGITIELGFAPLPLDGIGIAGVVDVPGHEAFVRTMLAGATGIDVALLVVAADEGVMPQTREHLAILSLLGVPAAVVALTKCDAVDPEWRALVADEVRESLAGTPFADVEIVATSAVTGAGLADLRRALAEAAGATPMRAADDWFRLPVDRAFSVRGTGTVVTGTVWSGTLRRDAQVRLLPAGRTARVRGLQRHGGPVDHVGPGERAAVALVGVEVAEAARGSVLVAGDGWEASRVWRAEAELLPDAGTVLGPRTRVRVHLGTAEAGGRLVAAGGGLAAGERRAVRVVLDAPLVARGGDRFVIRGGAPVATLGGGVVTDPTPPTRRARPWAAGTLDLTGRLLAMVGEGGAGGAALDALPLRLGASPGEVRALVAACHAVSRVGDRLLLTGELDGLAERVAAVVAAHHVAAPLELGMSRQALRSALAAPPEVADAVLERLEGAGVLVRDAGLVRRGGWRPSPSAAQQQVAARILARLSAVGLESPTVAELVRQFGPDVPALLALAEREEVIVALDRERYCAVEALRAAAALLESRLTRGELYTPSVLRETLGVSRKHLMPALEFFDRARLTERVGDARRWRGALALHVPREALDIG